MPDSIDFDSLWDYSKPAETEQKFREILPVVSDDSSRLQLLTQIARTQGLQGRFDDAHATLDDVEQKLTDTLPLPRVRYLLERGRAFNSSGKPELALPLFREAAEVGARNHLMKFAIDAVHMVAIAESDPQRQVEWNLRGIEMVKANPDQKRWLRALYNNLGEAYRSLKQYGKALECFSGINQVNRELGLAHEPYAGVDEAKMLRLLGRASESLPMIQALRAQEPANAFVAEELAESLLACGRSADALPLFKEAYAKLKNVDWLANSEPDRLARLKSLADAS